MDLNAIMCNIYGENAPQNFESLGFKGGSAPIDKSNIKYLDEDNPTQSASAIEQSFRASKLLSFTGGARLRKMAAEIAVLASAEYVDDPDCQQFIKVFFLHYLVTNAHKNMILVIPKADTLKAMVSEFKALLKKEGINELSSEASRYAAKTDLAFKNYIFDVYGKDSSDNAGFEYQIPGDWPEKPFTAVLRRTNRLSRHFFVKASGDKLVISESDKFTDSNELKFIAKCDREVFVVKGDVPASVKSSKSKVISAKLTGGARGHVLGKEFIRSIRRAYDIDSAAYNFVARCAKASGTQNISKYYSGDLIHTAFAIVADNQADIADDITPEEESQEHEKLINDYHPKSSSIKMDKVKIVLPRILKNAEKEPTPEAANASFIKSIDAMYSTINAPAWMVKADVATSLVRGGAEDEDAAQNALNMMNELEEQRKCPCGTNDDLNHSSFLRGGFKIDKHTETPFISSIYSALSSSPFIGSIAREYTPLLLRPSRKTRFVNSAFEDKHNINDDDDNDTLNITEGADVGGDDVDILADPKPSDANKNAEGESDSDNEASEDDKFDIRAFF